MDASIEKVVVAVHGVGDQTRFATLQQTLSQFCRYHGAAAGVPLGNFHTDGGTSLVLPGGYPAELRKLAFAEVYWAGIPRKVAKENYSLEDIKPWVRTIISRVRMRGLACRDLDAADQGMIEQVLGEMLQTIELLEQLCFLADKVGVFSFDLKKILVDYVDDVQIVAEFKAQGKKIGDTFEERMESVCREYPNAEIYIIAHSEGTVVSLLGLLSALCGCKDSAWIKNVRGFMTLGCPIDKHLILWPELFEAFTSPRRRPTTPIEWRNYYDFGDPVGFALDTARATFAAPAWTGVFNFPADHDHGFARYPLAGKAHIDYWQDPDVFGHFIQQVVYKDEKIAPKPEGRSYAKPPADKRVSQVISWVSPYLGALVLLFCAVLVLYNAAHGAVRPDLTLPVARAVSVVKNPLDEGPRQTFGSVAAITCLLAGLTVGARLPRLSGLWRWHLFGLGAFFLSIVAYGCFTCLFVSPNPFRTCLINDTVHGVFDFSIVGIAVLVLLAVYLVSRFIPAWGTQALLVPGSLALAYVLFRHIKNQMASLPNAHLELHQLWPVFLATAFFLYLWWLVALLFDLTFVWHRYIRFSGEGKYLRLPKTQGAQDSLPMELQTIAPLTAEG